METRVEFINHASLKIRSDGLCILSDPWFNGSAFNMGWRLQYEFDEAEILRALDGVTHIWISHEHPDHFSVPFFKKYSQVLIQENVKILFQETRDRRVVKFLQACNLEVIELIDGFKTNLSRNVEVTCIKNGFYDSALFVETKGLSVLNLNDCEFRTEQQCAELRSQIIKCDVLATQFNYAAWKGGISNIAWRKSAAKQKLEAIRRQVTALQPKIVIPFASFAYFSHAENSYLNDELNSPDVVSHYIQSSGVSVDVQVLRPFDFISESRSSAAQNDAVKFWNQQFQKSIAKELNVYDATTYPDLQEAYEAYKSRIFSNNSRWLLLIVRLIPIPVFQPIVVRLTDMAITVEVDLLSNNLRKTSSSPHVAMSGASLLFIFKSSFGFDTLTVNGCFEEASSGGFSRLSRTLALENLNNLGLSVEPKLIFRVDIIALFLSRLYDLKKKQRGGAADSIGVGG